MQYVYPVKLEEELQNSIEINKPLQKGVENALQCSKKRPPVVKYTLETRLIKRHI